MRDSLVVSVGMRPVSSIFGQKNIASRVVQSISFLLPFTYTNKPAC